MVTDVNQTYCGDHFTIYTNTESLHCTSETNITLYSIIPQFKKLDALEMKKISIELKLNSWDKHQNE